MTHCPTCNAALNETTVCRRCKTDLSRALEAARAAEKHYQAAVWAHIEGDRKSMLHHARCAFLLKKVPAYGRILACAALLNGHYRLAVDTWNGVHRLPCPSLSPAGAGAPQAEAKRSR